MIKTNNVLKNHIHTDTEFMIFDLYKITLLSGRILRFTDCEINLTYNDHTYITGPLWTRDKTKQTLGISNDVLKLHMYTNRGDTINGIPIIQMAQSGAFDGADFRLYSAYLDKDSTIIGALELYQGVMSVTEVKELDITYTVKPKTADLTTMLPNRLFYPSCPYTLFSEACGIDMDKFKVACKVVEATRYSVTIDKCYDSGYFANGSVKFTSGLLQDHISSIVDSNVYNNQTQIDLPLPLKTIPKKGDSLELIPGCNKTRQCCKARFNNIARWRGTPYVPRKEETI